MATGLGYRGRYREDGESRRAGVGKPLGRELLAGGYVQLAEDIPNMELDRPFADAEDAGDLFVREPAQKEIQHLALARGQ